MKNAHYPLVSDRNQRMSRAYRVLDEHSGAAVRATVVVDPKGIIASKTVYPKEVGRNLHELVRLFEAIQYNQQTGLGVPANWTPGQPGIRRDIANAGKY